MFSVDVYGYSNSWKSISGPYSLGLWPSQLGQVSLLTDLQEDTLKDKSRPQGGCAEELNKMFGWISKGCGDCWMNGIRGLFLKSNMEPGLQGHPITQAEYSGQGTDEPQIFKCFQWPGENEMSLHLPKLS